MNTTLTESSCKTTTANVPDKQQKQQQHGQHHPPVYNTLFPRAHFFLYINEAKEKKKKKKKKGIKICSALQKNIFFSNKRYISWLIYSRVSYLKDTVSSTYT